MAKNSVRRDFEALTVVGVIFLILLFVLMWKKNKRMVTTQTGVRIGDINYNEQFPEVTKELLPNHGSVQVSSGPPASEWNPETGQWETPLKN